MPIAIPAFAPGLKAAPSRFEVVAGEGSPVLEGLDMPSSATSGGAVSIANVALSDVADAAARLGVGVGVTKSLLACASIGSGRILAGDGGIGGPPSLG